MLRRKICKILIGSHLYGTDNSTSDHDYAGVYMPSVDDIFGLNPYPSEFREDLKISDGTKNQAGDVDCKFFALSTFMKLAASGQSAQIELLFAPERFHTEKPSSQWMSLVRHREIFLSKKSFVPFVTFAASQAHKAAMKGDNLKTIRSMLAWLDSLSKHQLALPIKHAIIEADGKRFLGPFEITVVKNESESKSDGANETQTELLLFAFKRYDLGAPLKRFVDSLKVIESRYGMRSKAAASEGLDFKSLSHAYRLIFEAEELLTTSQLTLPLREEERAFVRKVEEGRMEKDFPWHQDILERIAKLETVTAPNSRFPQEPDHERIKELHRELLIAHVKNDPLFK